MRNPLGPNGKALLLPLRNVDDVVMDQKAPHFGKPILLDLDELGVRDLAWSEELDAMFILAGKKNNETDFRLYRWSGERAAETEELTRITELNPEAVLVMDPETMLILSDDGDRMLPSTEQGCEKGFKDNECPCKRLTDRSRKQFRGRFVEIE